MIRELLFILMVWASSASAQALRVRSGEHDGYTRVVVQVPVGTLWTLTQRPNGAQLRVGIEGAIFDTRTAFDRLSRNRLQAKEQSEADGALDLTFGCDCTANAFLHRQSMIVIDIAPGSNGPARAALPELRPSPLVQNPLPAEIPATELALPLLQPDQTGIEDKLMARILQGADRDVVDLEIASIGRRSSTDFGPLRAQAGLAANLQLRSVLDDVRGLESLDLPQFDPRTDCITDNELGFEEWSNGESFAAQVSALRVGLYQEFDQIEEARVLNLARLYTYHGFGAEALQVLKLLPEPSDQAERLSAIAYVMDGLDGLASNPFSGQQRCDGVSAFWALMTERTFEPDANLNAIEQSFGRLPRHVRQQLGARLSQILVAAGKLESSRRILRAVERVLDDTSAEVTLAKAEIASAAGEKEEAETLLSDVATAATTTTKAPLALARLVEKRWLDRGAISPADLDLAAGYARQLRRSDLGPMMARTRVLALALSQEFDQALGHLEIADDTPDWQRTQDQVLQLLTERADDITFLRHVVGMPDQTRDGISVETAVTLAGRLADLGFAAPAHDLATRPQDQTRRIDRAQIRARTALLQDRPRQALLEIADHESSEAEKLRAQAMSQTEDYAEAAQLLREVGDDLAADRFNWLAEAAFDDAAQRTAFGQIHEISNQLTQPRIRQLDKPLTDAAALLEDSAAVRGQITELLGRTQLQSQN